MISYKEYLETHGAISVETIKRFGLYLKGNMLVIPIRDSKGNFLYNRYRHLDYDSNDSKSNKFTNDKGITATLFNTETLDEKTKEIVLTEGEIDAIRLEQDNIKAVSGTAGCGTFRKAWAKYLYGKKVYICYDTDAKGKEGARKVTGILLDEGIDVRIITLPNSCKDVCEYFNKGFTREDFIKLKDSAVVATKTSVTETPLGMERPELIKKPLSFAEVADVVNNYLPNSPTALALTLAVAVSALEEKGHPVWLLLVGVPSSGKTDQVKLIKYSSKVFFLDTMTLNAFVSGERQTESNKVFDLLPSLHGKCFTVKDWTAMFSQDDKAIKKLLGDLVNIYDKDFSKHSSRRGLVAYHSVFSHLGCITPAALNKHVNYLNMVGPRFLFYIIPDLTEVQQDESFDEIFNEGYKRSEKEKLASLYASSYLEQLMEKGKIPDYELTPEAQYYLKNAATLMARCRSIVVLQAETFRNDDNKDIRYYDPLYVQIEQPFRAVQQLIKLSTCLTYVYGSSTVGPKELAVIKEVVLSSMPADRALALKAIRELNADVTKKDVAPLCNMSPRTAHRLLDELTEVAVLEKVKGNEFTPNKYYIAKNFRNFILLDTAEFMSHIRNGMFCDDSENSTEGLPIFNSPTEPAQPLDPNEIFDGKVEGGAY